MQYEGHNVILTNGYYDVYFPEHPNARKNGSVLLQILVAEKILGRYLQKGEVVHHKDLNRLNNSPNNLMVFGSQSDHANYHAYVLKDTNTDFVLYRVNNVYFCQTAEVFFNQHNIQTINHHKVKPCPNCGKLIEIHSKLCGYCTSVSNRKVERPNRNQLKVDLRTLSFVKIGEKYSVTDNAVRKWCKFYNLPYRMKDITKLSKVDWDKL